MRDMPLKLFVVLFMLVISGSHCQSNNKSNDRCKEENIPHYTAYKITRTVTIDGNWMKRFGKMPPGRTGSQILFQVIRLTWIHVLRYCGTIRTCMWVIGSGNRM
jgi:hypothetical protein